MTTKEKEVYLILNGWIKNQNKFCFSDEIHDWLIFSLDEAFNLSQSGINTFEKYEQYDAEWFI